MTSPKRMCRSEKTNPPSRCSTQLEPSVISSVNDDIEDFVDNEGSCFSSRRIFASSPDRRLLASPSTQFWEWLASGFAIWWIISSRRTLIPIMETERQTKQHRCCPIACCTWSINWASAVNGGCHSLALSPSVNLFRKHFRSTSSSSMLKTDN